MEKTRINQIERCTALSRDVRVESPQWTIAQIGVPGEEFPFESGFFLAPYEGYLEIYGLRTSRHAGAEPRQKNDTHHETLT